jgi:hypothetical protein
MGYRTHASAICGRLSHRVLLDTFMIESRRTKY